jgi:uncharacterized membrane protein YkoI
MRLPIIAAAAAATMILSMNAHAQDTAMKEAKPGLLQKAKVSPEAATAAAQARVPKGKIVSAEIEVEHGKLLYSFDIRTEGKSGIDEVNVDAISGKVLGVQHETPKDEARETTADDNKR